MVIPLVVLLRRLVRPCSRNGPRLRLPHVVLRSASVTACKYTRQLFIMLISASEKASLLRILSITCSSYCLCGSGTWSLSSSISASMSLRKVRSELIHRTFRWGRFVSVPVRMGWLVPAANWVHARATLSNLLVWFLVRQNLRNNMIWPVPW
jgi:hypothetical protein